LILIIVQVDAEPSDHELESSQQVRALLGFATRCGCASCGRSASACCGMWLSSRDDDIWTTLFDDLDVPQMGNAWMG